MGRNRVLIRIRRAVREALQNSESHAETITSNEGYSLYIHNNIHYMLILYITVSR